jgi:Icc-related predicted phosphoesterase
MTATCDRIRVAAVGDVHVGVESDGELRAHLDDIAERADLLVVAGDLTRCGEPAEAEVAARELGGLDVPVVAVLGNHDHHAGKPDVVTRTLEDAGVCVLDGSATVIDVGGCRVGVAGSKGFGGGFAGACASDFGEPEMRAFVGHTVDVADRLEAALSSLDTDVRLVLLHYSPVEDTLRGERPEIYPFLGSYLLAQAIDRAGADVVFHGHAHAGSERGMTPGGIRVRNVAMPVIRHAYALYSLPTGTSSAANGGGEADAQDVDVAERAASTVGWSRS